MKDKTKNIIINTIIIILIAITIYFIISTINNYQKELTGSSNKPNNEPIDNINNQEEITYNKDITKSITKDNVKITNINISYINSYSLLKYTITNNSEFIIKDYNLIIKDKDKKIITILPAPSINELKINDTITQEIICDIDLTKAHSIELELEKEAS